MENEVDATNAGFSVNKFLLSAIGQWPYQSKWERRIIRIIGNGMMVVANLSSLTALYEMRDDIDAVIEQIPMAMTGVFYFINFLTLVSQTSEMRVLLDAVKSNFRKIKRNSEEEEKILIQAAKEGKFVILTYCLLVSISTFVYCSLTLLPVLLDILYPLDEPRSRNYVYYVDYLIFEKEDHYYFIFCHSTTSGIYCLATMTAFDTMFYLYVKHITAMFLVLEYRLKNCLKNDDICQILSLEDCIRIENQAISCMKLYYDIIIFTNKIESCFAKCLTFTMGISAVILSFQGVMIVVRIDEPDFVVKFATNFILQAVHLFYNCLTGQMLMDSSEALSNYIYNSRWYLMPPRSKRLLMMMMLRSIKDCKVTIGKFFILNNQTYTNLMKTVFSYLSILSSVRA